MWSNRFVVLAEDYKHVPAAVESDQALPRKIIVPRKKVEEPAFPQESQWSRSDQYVTVYYSKKMDPAVTRNIYMEWRLPRLCKDNPTDVTNPYYVAMIKCGWSAYSASQRFTGEGFSDTFGPGWCFSRFGRSRTVLDHAVPSLGGRMLEPGTKLFIAGEHEDFTMRIFTSTMM